MKRIQIDLTRPFEHLLSAVLSLPTERALKASTEAEITALLRELYEAVNGRQVETLIGLIPIAPPVAPSLKDETFTAATQSEFLGQVTAFLADGPGAAMCGAANPSELNHHDPITHSHHNSSAAAERCAA